MNAFGWRSDEYGVANLGQDASYVRVAQFGLKPYQRNRPVPTPEPRPLVSRNSFTKAASARIGADANSSTCR